MWVGPENCWHPWHSDSIYAAQALLLYLISPATPNKPPPVPPDLDCAGLDLDHLLLQAGLISAGMLELYMSAYDTCLYHMHIMQNRYV